MTEPRKSTRARRKPADKQTTTEGSDDALLLSLEKIRELLNDPLARLVTVLATLGVLYFTVNGIKADVGDLQTSIRRTKIEVADNTRRIKELQTIDERIDNLGARVHGIDEALERITRAISRAIEEAGQKSSGRT